MHRYRIAARLSLSLFILNLVLAAPIGVGPGVDDSGVVAPEGVEAIPKKSGELGAASDKQKALLSSQDEIAPPRHSAFSDGLASSEYSGPHLSSDLSVSGYSWLAERPPRPNLDFTAPSHELAPHDPSTSGPSEIAPLNLQASSSGSGLSEITGASTPPWLRELEGVLALQVRLDNLDVPTSGSHSPWEKFTLSHHPSSLSSATLPSTKYASASGGSLTSHYFSASDGLAHSEAPSSPGPPENAKFLSESMVKKLKIAGGLTVLGAIITGIAAPLIRHRDYQDK